MCVVSPDHHDHHLLFTLTITTITVRHRHHHSSLVAHHCTEANRRNQVRKDAVDLEDVEKKWQSKLHRHVVAGIVHVHPWYCCCCCFCDLTIGHHDRDHSITRHPSPITTTTSQGAHACRRD